MDIQSLVLSKDMSNYSCLQSPRRKYALSSKILELRSTRQSSSQPSVRSAVTARRLPWHILVDLEYERA